MVDAKRRASPLQIADNHTDASDPQRDGSDRELLEEVGQMRVAGFLSPLVDPQTRLINVLLYAQEILERSQWGAPFGCFRFRDVVEDKTRASHHQIVHQELRLAGFIASNVAEKIRHSVQSDFSPVEVISDRVAGIVRL